jgi:hypothetical protein
VTTRFTLAQALIGSKLITRLLEYSKTSDNPRDLATAWANRIADWLDEHNGSWPATGAKPDHPRTYSLVGGGLDMFLVTDDESGMRIGYARKIGGPLTKPANATGAKPDLLDALDRMTPIIAQMLRAEALCDKGHRKGNGEHYHYETVHEWARLLANERAIARLAASKEERP